MEQVDEAVVEGGLACFGCLYDLRGQPLAGRCPECGAEVAESFREDRWDRADVRWRRRVRMGVGIAPVEYVWMVGVMLTLGLLGVSGEVASVVAFSGMGVLALLSGWLIGSAEPGHGGAKRWRWAVRGLSVLAGLGHAGFAVTRLWFDNRYVGKIPLFAVVLITAMLINGLKQGVQLGYVATILGRVPGRPLRLARWVCAWPALAGWWGIGLVGLAVNVWNVPSVVGTAAGFFLLGTFLVTVVYEATAFWVLRRRTA